MESTVESKDEHYVSLHCYRKRKLPEKPVNEDTLSKILQNLPQEVYKPSWLYAGLHLGRGLTFLLLAAVCYYFATQFWFLYSLGWIFGGFAMLTFFNIGHDCAHKNWTSSSLVNDVIGELAFLPLMHPFKAFQFKHNFNLKLLKRTDLSATGKSLLSHPHSSLSALGFMGFMKEYYDLFTFPSEIRGSVLRSISCSLIFFAILFYLGGIRGAILYWLVPLILYKDVFYMKWLEWSRRGLDVHFPTRIATSIPSYNLRLASDYIHSCTHRKQEDEELLRLQKDAENQKLGDKKPGYDHPYGPELPLGSDIYTEALNPTPIQIEQLSPKSFAKEAAKPKKAAAGWWTRINWINVVILFGTPVGAIVGFSKVGLCWQTCVFTLIYYFFSGLGITAGYHRLFAHRAYEASTLVRFFLMLGGTAALEGSVKWWCGGHRVHHRYTDTPKDPYNAKHGFWWSHLGWMIVKPDAHYKVKADIRDLQADPMINFQHTNYLWMGLLMAFGVPSIISYVGWGDFWGGLVYAGFLRQVFVHHATFCVNSMAHYFGNHTYDDERTPRDHILTALVTIGEGYHNFHHEFPNDYRNGIRPFDYDPTKWLIRGLSLFGLTYNLKEFPANEVAKGKLHMKQKKLDTEKAQLMYPADIKSLPVWSWDDIKRKIQLGSLLVVVDQLVHDVSNFLNDHPGGVPLLKAAIGKDGTNMFNGNTGVYKHSQAARHLLTTFRVARLPTATVDKQGQEVERQQKIE